MSSCEKRSRHWILPVALISIEDAQEILARLEARYGNRNFTLAVTEREGIPFYRLAIPTRTVREKLADEMGRFAEHFLTEG